MMLPNYRQLRKWQKTRRPTTLRLHTASPHTAQVNAANIVIADLQPDDNNSPLMSEVQDNVVKECWVEEAGLWEELPSCLSTPKNVGERRRRSREHDDNKVSDFYDLNLLTIKSASSFSGAELVTTLCGNLSSSRSIDAEIMVESVCTQLLLCGVLQVIPHFRTTPETPPCETRSSQFILTDMYRWTAGGQSSFHHDEKLKKLRLHNKHLKTRLNNLTDQLNRQELQSRANDGGRGKCVSLQSLPCQIELYAEGKTSTSVSTPNTVLSISTLSEDSGSRVSLSFTSPNSEIPGYSIHSNTKSPSDGSCTTSSDSYKTAVESPNDNAYDTDDEPITMRCHNSSRESSETSTVQSMQNLTLQSDCGTAVPSYDILAKRPPALPMSRTETWQDGVSQTHSTGAKQSLQNQDGLSDDRIQRRHQTNLSNATIQLSTRSQDNQERHSTRREGDLSDDKIHSTRREGGLSDDKIHSIRREGDLSDDRIHSTRREGDLSEDKAEEIASSILCYNCKQLVTARSRLSNASVDSGLSQSYTTFPACNVVESDALPETLSGVLPLSHSTPVFNTDSDESNAVPHPPERITNLPLEHSPATANHGSLDRLTAPPPPPPPMFNHTMPRRRKPVKPKTTLKPLHWRRILLQSKGIGAFLSAAKQSPACIWDKLKEPKIDTDELEELFALDDAKSSPARTLKRKSFTKVLERKRSQNLAIILSRVRQPFSEFRKALIYFDVSFLPIDTWKALCEAKATEKELTEIRDQKETDPRCVLDKPEQFLYDLSYNMPFGVERISCFLVRSHCEEVVKDVSFRLDNLSHVCGHMMSSLKIEKLLSLLLAVGNYLNGGNNHRGQADGFSLDILPKLKDIRGKKQMSLLNYIARKYKAMHGGDASHVEMPLPSIDNLQAASNLNYVDLSQSLETLSEELKDCKTLMAKVQTTLDDNSENQVFHDVMSSFLAQSTQTIKDLSRRMVESKAKFRKLSSFYSAPHTDSQNTTPAQFFEPWLSFSRDLHSVWELSARSSTNKTSAHF